MKKIGQKAVKKVSKKKDLTGYEIVQILSDLFDKKLEIKMDEKLSQVERNAGARYEHLLDVIKISSEASEARDEVICGAIVARF